ncbi:Sulphatase-modifying factor domain protein, partial [Candidatus Magnetomorum sp. HK-1]
QFINATSYKTDAEKEGWAYGWNEKTGWDKQKGHSWKNTHFQQNDNHPVINISWNDAIALTEWLSEKGNGQYRLPTEAEWEYACRAGTQTPFYFGETISTEHANYDGNYIYANGKKGIYRKQTAPVGTFPANKFGLYDMHGNVWEWCADSYAKDAYSKHERNNPIYEDTGASLRVLRGGSWDDGPRYVRSAVRNRNGPATRGSNIGARLLRKS